MKTLLATGVAALALVAGAASAQAESQAEAFDSCKPHDWLRYGEAVEAQDYAALAAMLNEPELRICGALVASVTALVCANDPLACVAPAAGSTQLGWFQPEVFGYEPLSPNDQPLPWGPGPLGDPDDWPQADLPVPPREWCDECPGLPPVDGGPVPPRLSVPVDVVPVDVDDQPQGDDPVPPRLSEAPRAASTCCDYVDLFQGQGPFPNQAPGESYGGSRDHASSQPASPSSPASPSPASPSPASPSPASSSPASSGSSASGPSPSSSTGSSTGTEG